MKIFKLTLFLSLLFFGFTTTNAELQCKNLVTPELTNEKVQDMIEDLADKLIKKKTQNYVIEEQISELAKTIRILTIIKEKKGDTFSDASKDIIDYLIGRLNDKICKLEKSLLYNEELKEIITGFFEEHHNIEPNESEMSEVINFYNNIDKSLTEIEVYLKVSEFIKETYVNDEVFDVLEDLLNNDEQSNDNSTSNINIKPFIDGSILGWDGNVINGSEKYILWFEKEDGTSGGSSHTNNTIFDLRDINNLEEIKEIYLDIIDINGNSLNSKPIKFNFKQLSGYDNLINTDVNANGLSFTGERDYFGLNDNTASIQVILGMGNSKQNETIIKSIEFEDNAGMIGVSINNNSSYLLGEGNNKLMKFKGTNYINDFDYLKFYISDFLKKEAQITIIAHGITYVVDGVEYKSSNTKPINLGYFKSNQ